MPQESPLHPLPQEPGTAHPPPADLSSYASNSLLVGVVTLICPLLFGAALHLGYKWRRLAQNYPHADLSSSAKQATIGIVLGWIGSVELLVLIILYAGLHH